MRDKQRSNAMRDKQNRIRLDTLRCSGCNKRFQAVATGETKVACPHCSMQYKFVNGSWQSWPPIEQPAR